MHVLPAQAARSLAPSSPGMDQRSEVAPPPAPRRERQEKRSPERLRCRCRKLQLQSHGGNATARLETSAVIEVVSAPIEDHPPHRRRPLAADPHAGARLREGFEPTDGLGGPFIEVSRVRPLPALARAPASRVG